MGMIILEGPDGAGKTCLGQALADDLGLDIRHEGGPPEDHAELERRMELPGDRQPSIILDRYGAISELVYGPIVRDGPMLPDTDLWQNLRDLSHRQPVALIYCRPSMDTILAAIMRSELKAHKSAEHMTRVRTRSVDLIRRYDLIMPQIAVSTAMAVIWHDWSCHDPLVLSAILRRGHIV